jgi:hypothetical protein
MDRNRVLRQFGNKCLLLLLSGFDNAGHAYAAGGNHFVDDAAMLAPGHCQVEVWGDRERNGNRKLLHAGPACRAGPVELGFNLDHTSVRGVGNVTVAGPQMKWTRALNDSFSAGVVVAAGWQDNLPRFLGTTVVFPVTWQAGTAVLLHANLGWDFRHRSSDTLRAGVSAEWTPLPAWSLVAERFRESDTNFWRAGVRYAVSPQVSIDLNRAGGLNGASHPWWTVGLTRLFAR